MLVRGLPANKMAPGLQAGSFYLRSLGKAGILIVPPRSGRECLFALFRNGRGLIVTWDNYRCVPSWGAAAYCPESELSWYPVGGICCPEPGRAVV